MTTTEIEKFIKSAFNRTLGTAAPYFSKYETERLAKTAGYTLEDSSFEECLSSMASKDIIYFVKDDECYILAHEDFVKTSVKAAGYELQDGHRLILKSIDEAKAKWGVR